MSQPETSESSRSWRWPLIVVGFLAFNVVTQGVLLAFALNDPGFRLEPDYYRRALAWDQERAEEAQAAAQGWRLAAEVLPAPAGAQVLVRLEEGGRPLEGAEVRLVAFHPAHGQETVRARLTPGEPGRWAAVVPLRRAGRWVVRLEAQRGPAVLRQELRAELPGAGP